MQPPNSPEVAKNPNRSRGNIELALLAANLAAAPIAQAEPVGPAETVPMIMTIVEQLNGSTATYYGDTGTGYLLRQEGEIRLVTTRHVIKKAQQDNRFMIRATFRGQEYEYRPSEFTCDQTPGLVDPLCSAPVPASIQDLPQVYENAPKNDFYVGEKLFFPKKGVWHEYSAGSFEFQPRLGQAALEIWSRAPAGDVCKGDSGAPIVNKDGKIVAVVQGAYIAKVNDPTKQYSSEDIQLLVEEYSKRQGIRMTRTCSERVFAQPIN